ncbi:MAG: response regulator [Candidatus Margulisbacteria bacterium]|nr:response regulator [Candidatus Margulisiibacteriota bacterium]
MLIMVIDDELISRKKLAEILKPFGECMEFDRGDVALVAYEKARKEYKQIDLVTIDISMPYLNGLSVLHKIRDIETELGVPKELKAKVIMVTSENDRNKFMDAMQQGCDDYILKPFDENNILERLKSHNILPKT